MAPWRCNIINFTYEELVYIWENDPMFRLFCNLFKYKNEVKYMGTYEKCLLEIKSNPKHAIMVRESDRNKVLYIRNNKLINQSGASTNEDVMADDWCIINTNFSAATISTYRSLRMLPDEFIAVYTDNTTEEIYMIRINKNNREKLEFNMFDLNKKEFIYNLNGKWYDYKPSISDMIHKNWYICNTDDYLKELIERYLFRV